MAQPNLSKAIKELEDTLGIILFERTSKGVIPTPKGAEFLLYAQNILSQLEKMEQLSVPEGSDLQRFNISIPRGSYIADGFIKFAAELDTQKPIDINIQETNSMQAINNMAEGQYNLGIIRYQTVYENYFLDYLSEKKICYDPIWEFEYLALMSQKHPLATSVKVNYSDLNQYVEIMHGDTVVPYLSSSELKKESQSNLTKKKIYVYERSSQFNLLMNIPATYMWVSPIPDNLLSLYQLVQRKCEAVNHKYKDLLIYPNGYKFSALDIKFIDKLYESKNEVAFQEYF